MSSLPMQVVLMLGQTIEEVVPITIVLALVFTVAGHLWACNPGTPWWRKRELVTDIVYWFFVPLFARVAGTFPIWDILFGTFRMPENRTPAGYRKDEADMPSEIVGQLAFPFRH